MHSEGPQTREVVNLTQHMEQAAFVRLGRYGFKGFQALDLKFRTFETVCYV